MPISCQDSCPHTAVNGSSKRVALLLAGGNGTRLQDLTRQIAGIPIPKQYCRLWRDSSLLESSISRAELFTSRNHISVVVNQDHLHLAKEQLRALLRSNVLVQPQNRDTGPGILFALLKLERNYPDAIVAVFPTDHFIDDDHAFIAHVLRSTSLISQMPDKIGILGVVPDRPETGYGYIIPSNPLGVVGRTYHVEVFIEKPDLSSARKIILRGGLWNTFVMVFKISRMLELVHELVPNHFERLWQVQEFPEKAAALYETLEPWNFSTQVLSRIPEHLIMHEVADVHWSDWGTRESVERTYKSLNVTPFWNISNSAAHPVLG